MENVTEFSESVSKALGHYVYRLIDPRNGETFYVGKGKGNRVFAHIKAALTSAFEPEDDTVSLKLSRIMAIRNAGLEVVHVIHRHDIPGEAILEVEAALIDAFPGLANIQGGYGSGSKGPMSVTEIKNKYELPAIIDGPAEKLVLININRLDDRSNQDAILRQTRLAWRISKERAEEADYVLAVVRGVTLGVFVADEWLDATHANFPEHVSVDEEMPERKGFIGRPAPEEVWEKFVGKSGKRIAIDDMKHIQNPVRYWNIKT